VKDSFWKEFPKYQIKFPLGNFSAKLVREDIFKPTIGNDSLHETNYDNAVRVVTFATSKIWLGSSIFLHRNIHKFTLDISWWKTSQSDSPCFQRQETAFKCTRHLIFQDSDFLYWPKVRDRLAVSKQIMHKCYIVSYNFKKLNSVEGNGQYHVEIKNRFEVLENL
jgi:hypothetical protein